MHRHLLISNFHSLLPVVLCVALLIIAAASESSVSIASTPTSVVTANTISRTEEMATVSTNSIKDNDVDVTVTSAAVKTIFLVRHAESDENRRLHSLKTAFKDLTRFALPKTKDIMASCELIRIDQQINSNVSQFGKQQIAFMANRLKETNFVTQQNVQLLVHSPLLRAKETCRDMFGCIASNEADESSPLLPPPLSSALTKHNISEVIELDLLTEMTPMEWIPGNAGSLQKRMRALETWLADRPETTIVCVGHSQYFKALLQLPYKFQNCDVIRVQFHPSGNGHTTSTTTTTTTTTASKWSNIHDEQLCRITTISDDTCDSNGVNTSDGTGTDSTAAK